MASAIGAWMVANRDVYIGNATAMRDFRVQLRGNRSVLLFGLYLFVLIGVALIVYSSTSGMSGMSGVTIVDAQSHLKQFYETTMGLLGLTVCIVAPGLTATSIVAERQRQSIDLVFSAPVTPKYYLVGKMISSFRYTWMLLVLSLPVTAASVVLGGASWADVLVAYILLSLQGLILTAFALLMSAVSPKPVGAIIWSYAASLLYNIGAYAASSTALATLRYGRGGGAGSEAPCFVALSPWTVGEAARTYMTLGGHQVPNWLIMAVVSLLIVKICLLGAGALLSPSGGKEVVGLRIHALLYTATLSGIAGWMAWEYLCHIAPTSFSSSGIGSVTGSAICGIMVSWVAMPIFLFMPFVGCFGFDRERRYMPNGVFSIRHLLDGTPAGGFPFLLSMLLCLFGGFAFGGWYHMRIGVSFDFWIFAIYSFTLWFFFWSLARLVSSLVNNLKTSRVLVFSGFMFLVVMPYPFLLAVAGIDLDINKMSLWDLYILEPITGRRAEPIPKAILFSAILFGLDVVITAIGESRTRTKLKSMRNYDERPYQAA